MKQDVWGSDKCAPVPGGPEKDIPFSIFLKIVAEGEAPPTLLVEGEPPGLVPHKSIFRKMEKGISFSGPPGTSLTELGYDDIFQI